MTTNASLPPGQIESASFPRFGLLQFADRFPEEPTRLGLSVGGDVANALTIGDELAGVPRVEQRSDFHCVTTWTARGLLWSGYRFSDVYHGIVKPLASPSPDVAFVALRGQDGYRSLLPLDDLLADDVLLADRLDGEPLSIAHGAPLRLVAPAHYGYKSVKHVHRLELWRRAESFRPLGPAVLRFMAHPRARVAHEERGRWFPGWLLRRLYRPLVSPTAARFEKALRRHEGGLDSRA